MESNLNPLPWSMKQSASGASWIVHDGNGESVAEAYSRESAEKIVKSANQTFGRHRAMKYKNMSEALDAFLNESGATTLNLSILHAFAEWSYEEIDE